MTGASIVVVGSLNADFVVHVARFPVPGESLRGDAFVVMPGGTGGNQACAAARLGGSVALAGQVGNDSHGEWLRRSLEAIGVDAHLVSTDDASGTGVATTPEMRIRWGFHRPIRIHFARIGTVNKNKNNAQPETTDRR